MKLAIPYINQANSDADELLNDCGIACVAMMANAKGLAVTVDEMVTENPGEPIIPDTDGLVSVETIRLLCGAYGLPARRLADLAVGDLMEYLMGGRPAILLVDYGVMNDLGLARKAGAFGHFVLVVGYDDTGFFVHDPYWLGEDGANRHWTDEELEQVWCGGWGSSGNYYNGLAIVPDDPVVPLKRSLYGFQGYMGFSDDFWQRLKDAPVKPTNMKLIGCHDKAALVREICGPETVIICRDFLGGGIDDDFRQLLRATGDPKAAALYDYQQQEKRINATAKDVVWETSVNEFNVMPNEDAAAMWQAYADYSLEYCKITQGHGRKAAVLTWTTGTPEAEYYPIFKELVKYVHANGHWLVPHEYKGLWAWHWWGPNQDKYYKTQDPPRAIANPPGLYAGWLVGRFVQALAAWGYCKVDPDTLAVSEVQDNLPNIIIGEYGQGPLKTEGVFVDAYGLRAWPDALNTDSARDAWLAIDGLDRIDGYLQDVQWLDNFYNRIGIKGINYFCNQAQDHPVWKWYNMDGAVVGRVFDHLRDYRYAGGQENEEPEEPGGEDAMTREAHYRNIEAELEALRALDDPQPNTTKFQTTVALRLREVPNGTILVTMPQGSEVLWAGVSDTIGGLLWYKVTYGNLAGWCAKVYLTPLV